MKQFLTGITILITQLSFGQSYEEQIYSASQSIQNKDFRTALTIFKTAFLDTTKINAYELYAAAVSATNCSEDLTALIWLNKSRQKGIGQKPGEIDYIMMDSALVNLHKYPEWTNFISGIRQDFTAKLALHKKQSEDWVNTITENNIKEKTKSKYYKCTSGFALYYTKVENLEIPYLVYIPKSYTPKTPNKAIVYLHGGVVNTENFRFASPEIGNEPIFLIADTLNSIIIYPLGKKDFGWVKQKEAFENVLSIVNRVESTYNIDKNNIILGGMSNGGSATFWFASQKPNVFKGFYAFSALPELEIAEIKFENISTDKPFYTINAMDDSIYEFEKVYKIYNDNKDIAKGWYSETVESGEHGFIYQSKGKEIMFETIEKLQNK